MKKKIPVVLCVGLLLAGVIGCIWVLTRPEGVEVQIVQDGNVLYRIDLSEAEDQTIDIVYEGRVNTVQIEGGRIRMLSADCPNHTCVQMGWLESGALPIVCLPNHLVIRFAEDDSGLDAVIP